MTRRQQRAHRERGFGMIEVLISVALYGIALVSLMGLLITSVTAGSIGETAAVAVNLARQRIEALTTLTLPALIAENGVVTTTQVPSGQGRPYTISVAIDNQTDFVDVSVTVTWSVAGAQTYSRTLVTRVAK